MTIWKSKHKIETTLCKYSDAAMWGDRLRWGKRLFTSITLFAQQRPRHINIEATFAIQWYSPNVRYTKYMKGNKHGSLHLASKICSELTVFLELRSGKSVAFSEQMVSADKYPSILTIVYIWLLIVDTALLKNCKVLCIWALVLNLLSG